jgi:hypothetical protein
MSLQQSPTINSEYPYAHNGSQMRLHGRILRLARICWIALVAFNLAMFVASLPALVATLKAACTTAACQTIIAPESVKQIQEAGLSVNFYLTYIYANFVVFLLVFLTIGAVIFWLRSSDIMALYTSFVLVSFGMVFNAGTFVALLPAWWLPIQLVAFLGNVSLGAFFYLFPSGRFVPGWTRWLVIGWLVYAVVSVFFPNSSLNNSWLIGILFLGLLASTVAAQVYRYRRVSSQAERQQTKWVVFGVAIAVTGFVSVVLLFWDNVLSFFPQGPLADLISETAATVFILLIPLSIAFAILRSRLWEIDIIINRTLVYGTLTGILALVYLGSILLLQSLLRAIIHQNNAVAIVISTLLIAALFNPLRHRIQQIIDRRFYRQKYDAAKIVEAFSATLRNEVDLSQLCEQLITVVQDTMQPAHVSLWLRQSTSSTTPSLQTSKAPTEEAKVREQSAGHGV